MGWFDKALVIFKEAQDPKSFLLTFHEKLKSTKLQLEIDDYEFITYSDTRDNQEREFEDLDEGMTVEKVIDLLCDWPGLGLLGYRHEDFAHSISINYLTWDDHLMHGFSLGFFGKEFLSDQSREKRDQLIRSISELVDYRFVVGDVGDLSKNEINTRDELPAIIAFIEQRKFELDLRA